MRRFLILPAVLLSLALAGCGTTSVFQGGTSLTATIQNPVTREQQAGMEAAYNLVASGAAAYSRLRRCKTGEVESISNLCSRWSVVQKLVSANRIAYTAIKQTRNFVDNNKTISAITAYNAATAALRDFKAIAYVNGIKVD